MKKTIIVGCETGGQGKTTTTLLLHAGYDLANCPIKLMSVDTRITDNKSNSKVEEGSKLAKFLGKENVTQITIDPDMKDIVNDESGTAILKHWDEFGEALMEGGYLIDMGANTPNKIFSWAKEREAGDILRDGEVDITFVIPTLAQKQALDDAYLLAQKALSQNDIPIKEIFIILNKGNFSGYETSDAFQGIKQFEKDGKVKIIQLDNCRSELMSIIDTHAMSFAEIMQTLIVIKNNREAKEDFNKRFNLKTFESSGMIAKMFEWLALSIKKLEDAGLCPSIDDANAENSKSEEVQNA